MQKASYKYRVCGAITFRIHKTSHHQHVSLWSWPCSDSRQNTEQWRVSVSVCTLHPGARSLVRVQLAFDSFWEFSSLLTKWESKVSTKWAVIFEFTWQSLSRIVKWQSKLKWPSSDRKVTKQNIINYSRAWSETIFQSEPKVSWTLTNECIPGRRCRPRMSRDAFISQSSVHFWFTLGVWLTSGMTIICDI